MSGKSEKMREIDSGHCMRSTSRHCNLVLVAYIFFLPMMHGANIINGRPNVDRIISMETGEGIEDQEC